MELPILLVRVRLMNRSGNVSKDRTSRSPPVGSGQSPTKSWYYWRARFVRGTMSRGTKVQRKYVVHTSVDPNIGEDPLINFGLLFFLQFLLVSVSFYFAVRMFRCFSLSKGHYHKIHISSMCSRISHNCQQSIVLSITVESFIILRVRGSSIFILPSIFG